MVKNGYSTEVQWDGSSRHGDKDFGENGQKLPAGEIGEIYMRFKENAGSTYEYIALKAKQSRTGDSLGYGTSDEDALYLADRRTDMIICGGANISPAEVEAALDEFPGVRSSAVIGLPHEDLGMLSTPL